MYDVVLLPTDGSNQTTEALEHAIPIAKDNDAVVHVLYVLDRRHFMAATAETKDEIRRSLDEEAERALDEASVRVREEGLECVTSTREGVPHREIEAYAHEVGIDLVVIGTHGKTGPERVATLGSTTERVVKGAEIPVLVVNLD